MASVPQSGAIKGMDKRGGLTLWQKIRRDRWMYLFIVPGALYFLVFNYLPLAGNIVAFQDYSPYLGFRESPWVGLDNFERLFSDPDFRVALVNTIQIEILQLVFAFPAPLLLALLLHSLVSDRTKRSRASSTSRIFCPG
jgi:putative aldouronate transport system permease protein